MADNDLVADEEPVDGTEGAGAVDSVTGTVNAISGGNWAEGLLGGAGAVGDVAEMAADPLAALASAGVGWLMEHVDFLKEPLDAVTGDKAAVDAISESWGNVSEEIREASQELTQAVKKDTESWEGAASTAYQASSALHAENLQAVATAASGAGTMVDMCGIALGVVRDIIRDLISKAVGELIAAAIEWAAVEAVTLGVATPGMIGDLVRRAVSWANKIAGWTEKITTVFKNAWDKLDELGEGVTKVKDTLSKGASKLESGRQTITADPMGEGISISRPETPGGEWSSNLTQQNFVNEAGNNAADGLKTHFAGELDDSYNSDDDK